ncbi:MAG: HAMP domain-containing protein [Clostridiales bacterium]|nr:HAMP domain-containing protein [Clostridiales bacterium]
MKVSIRVKLILLLILLTAGTIGASWFINNTFLEGYYLKNKQSTIENAYLKMNDLFTDSSLSGDDISLEMEQMGENYNLTYIIVDNSLRPIYYNVKDFDTLKNILLPYLLGVQKNDSSIIKNTGLYMLLQSSDERYHTSYIELWGYIEAGNSYVLLRSPVESIRESVAISNRFMAYVGIIVILVSIVIMFFVSKRFTKPILQLADISEKMSDLDFNVRYTGKDNDEISILGNSMNRLSEKLESTISELKSANVELEKDIKKKIQVDEMRTEFLSNVSHELKTPIALIQGYAEGLREGISDNKEDREFYCDVIIDEANKMNILVKKLLTLNQIEFGNDMVTMERFDIVELIRGVLHSSEILIKQKDIKVFFEEKMPIYVWGDEYQIEEVVVNYLSNALNHVDNENQIKIVITKEDAIIRVSVYNSGEGIPEEDIDKVWQKFYKVDKARTREYGGSGIGLSIVKAIMESMNKEYGVKNHEGGVEFWFELDN